MRRSIAWEEQRPLGIEWSAVFSQEEMHASRHGVFLARRWLYRDDAVLSLDLLRVVSWRTRPSPA